MDGFLGSILQAERCYKEKQIADEKEKEFDKVRIKSIDELAQVIRSNKFFLKMKILIEILEKK